jgi:hypothetical protein
MHPTPLRVDKIIGILKAGVRSNAFPIYSGGAGDGQTVGPPRLPLCSSVVCWQATLRLALVL